MPTSVTIHHSAWGDDRFIALARYAGYVDADYALIKMARVWSLCTELGTDIPPIDRIATCLMVDDVHATLVRARLGEALEDGSVRVRGCDGRIEWFLELPSQQAAAGKKRAQGAVRDARGRLIKAPAPSSGTPAVTSASPPPLDKPLVALDQRSSSALVKTPSAIQRSPASEPEPVPEQARPGSDPDRGALSGASGSGLPGDLVQASGPAADASGSATDAAASRTAAPAASPPAHPPGALGALCERFIRLVNEARARVATARGISDVRPLPAIIATSSTHLRELRERLEHAADPAGDMEHVIAIAEAEATEDGEKLKWLGWSLARENAWSVKLAASLAPGKRKPAKARDVRIGPADAPEGHRYESFVMDGSEAFKR